MKPKVLIVSYLFPPIGGGGVQRALKMAKYLNQYGWQPHILTVDEDVYFASKDESLLEQLPPEVTIHRAKQLDILGKLSKPNATNEASLNQATSVKTSQMFKIKQSMLKLLKKFFKLAKNRLLIPDDQILWYRSAVKAGLDAIKKHDIKAIFSTSGPNTNHLVAYTLKKKTGIPWIADFRDPWTDNMHRSGIWWREKLEANLEAKVIKNADVITTVTESFLEGFHKKYGSQIKRGVVIHNGYDIADYDFLHNMQEDELEKKHSKRLKLAYTGIFYEKRNPRLLLQALKELVSEQVINPGNIELHFAGIFDYPGQNANWNAVIDAKLEKQVVLHGQLPHRKALQLLSESDVLLLIADTDANAGAYIPGKLFEYIAIGKPILALTHKGESTAIIESLGNGIIVNPTSLIEMKLALTKLYQNWLTTEAAFEMPADLLEKTEKYQRHEQARMLAELLTKNAVTS